MYIIFLTSTTTQYWEHIRTSSKKNLNNQRKMLNTSFNALHQNSLKMLSNLPVISSRYSTQKTISKWINLNYTSMSKSSCDMRYVYRENTGHKFIHSRWGLQLFRYSPFVQWNIVKGPLSTLAELKLIIHLEIRISDQNNMYELMKALCDVTIFLKWIANLKVHYVFNWF